MARSLRASAGKPCRRRTAIQSRGLTGGGPGSATRYVGVQIFKEVFPRTNYGYGSAVSVIVLYLTIVTCWLMYIGLIAPRNKGKG